MKIVNVENVTKEEVELGNTILSNFMQSGHWECWKKNGYKPNFSDVYKTKLDCELGINIYVYDNEHMCGKEWAINFIKENEAKFIPKNYYEDWNLIMEVWQRFREKTTNLFISIGTTEDPIIKESISHQRNISLMLDFAGKLQTWMMLIEAVEWYNLIKQ